MKIIAKEKRIENNSRITKILAVIYLNKNEYPEKLMNLQAVLEERFKKRGVIVPVAQIEDGKRTNRTRKWYYAY